MRRILITGGSGKVAALLRPRLARPGRTLRLLDLRPPDPVAGGEFVVAGVEDLDALTLACKDVDAVVHLGGLAKEDAQDNVLRVNVAGTLNVLEAARLAGVRRVVLASSSHAAGFTEVVGRTEVPADVPGRPDTLYGWSKVAGEAAGRLYADRFGMDVLCPRIGMWTAVPPSPRGLAMWLSPDDGARLVEACLTAPAPGFRLLWGISRNTRRWASLAEGEAIGYDPRDDAEVFVDDLGARELDLDLDPAMRRAGGAWCEIPLGVASNQR
ncbi:NAD-dependent epimerase/dehydratase family protein [Dactylosporangium siamense]|uniref:NAD-dependent dehydratase n=1 Tax=Dactylosporangium siamense TaxID=685454 RepID=A0A919UAT1_9ACTN|nr:NAD(P)-dependent oxidoreductase [Dactylosporangium siamense]GIG48372.1 NAD-dependent dehydratase [Dactylosporangium siamense]